MGKDKVFTRKDLGQCLIMALITIFFSIPRAEFWQAVLITLRHVAAYFVYGFALVFIFIAMLKKADLMERFFETKPDKIRLVKWAIGVSALLAVYQAFHELFQQILA